MAGRRRILKRRLLLKPSLRMLKSLMMATNGESMEKRRSRTAQIPGMYIDISDFQDKT